MRRVRELKNTSHQVTCTNGPVCVASGNLECSDSIASGREDGRIGVVRAVRWPRVSALCYSAAIVFSRDTPKMCCSTLGVPPAAGSVGYVKLLPWVQSVSLAGGRCGLQAEGCYVKLLPWSSHSLVCRRAVRTAGRGVLCGVTAGLRAGPSAGRKAAARKPRAVGGTGEQPRAIPSFGFVRLEANRNSADGTAILNGDVDSTLATGSGVRCHRMRSTLAAGSGVPLPQDQEFPCRRLRSILAAG